jgi:hypothetical protein
MIRRFSPVRAQAGCPEHIDGALHVCADVGYPMGIISGDDVDAQLTGLFQNGCRQIRLFLTS